MDGVLSLVDTRLVKIENGMLIVGWTQWGSWDAVMLPAQTYAKLFFDCR